MTMNGPIISVSGTGTWSPVGPINWWQFATYRLADGSVVTMPVTVAGDKITFGPRSA